MTTAFAGIVDRVVANVNGEIILLSDLKGQMAALENLKRQKADIIPNRDLTQRAVLKMMIDEKVVAHYAEESGVTVTEEEIDKSVEEIKERNGFDDKTLLLALKSQGLTLDKYRDTLKNQMLIQRVTGKEITGPNVSDTEAREYYTRHSKEFIKPGRVRASHIVLLASEESTPELFNEARSKIRKILEEIRGGADFADMAKKYSQDGSAKNGGDLGWFGKGSMLPAFEQVAFSLKKGEISGPVLTRYGFHLIKVMDREEPAPLPFTSVKNAIRGKLNAKLFERKRAQWLARLRDKSYIEIIYGKAE